ncbi:hypothetical protein DIPPA_10465 [Diplonema papillatum]|nr:hypothetical protein DIPPA_10465 [Diplonema papillatum]
MLDEDALHDARIVAAPEAVAPLDGLAVPLVGSQQLEYLSTRRSRGRSGSAARAVAFEDDWDGEDDAISEPLVWDRLLADGAVQTRNRDARHALRQHRLQVAEEALAARPPKRSGVRPYSPRQRRRSPSPQAELDPRVFSFSPKLGEHTEVLASGNGKTIWTHLHKKRGCRDCSPPPRPASPPTFARLSPKQRDEAHKRLYRDAFKKSPEDHSSRSRFTFHPVISPRSEHLVRNRPTPAYSRLFSARSPSPTRITESQVLEASTSGVAIRREPSVCSERLRVLSKGDAVSVDPTRVIADEEGSIWVRAVPGWVRAMDTAGRRSLRPSVDPYTRDDSGGASSPTLMFRHPSNPRSVSRTRSRSMDRSPTQQARAPSRSRYEENQRKTYLTERYEQLNGLM